MQLNNDHQYNVGLRVKKTKNWPFLFIVFILVLAIVYSRLITHAMIIGKYYFKYHECTGVGESMNYYSDTKEWDYRLRGMGEYK